MPDIRWELSIFASRWRNRLRYMFRLRRTYRNWWAVLLPKCGVSVVLELRNGLRYLVRPQTTDLGVVNEAVMLDPYMAPGYLSVAEDGVVVDVGANIGDFTMQMARACPRGRVIAVEPIGEHARFVRIQALLNDFQNVSAAHLALGSREGETEIHAEGGFSSAFWGGGAAETVRITTLPRLMEEFAIDRIDLLKLDCEGAEWEILPAAEEVLPLVRQICMEFHCMQGWTPQRLAVWLSERGYQVKHTDGSWNGLLWAYRPATPAPSKSHAAHDTNRDPVTAPSATS